MEKFLTHRNSIAVDKDPKLLQFFRALISVNMLHRGDNLEVHYCEDTTKAWSEYFASHLGVELCVGGLDVVMRNKFDKFSFSHNLHKIPIPKFTCSRHTWNDMMVVENINQIRTCRHMWNQAFLCAEKYFLMMMTRHLSDVCTNLFVFSSLCRCRYFHAEKGKKGNEIRRTMLRHILHKAFPSPTFGLFFSFFIQGNCCCSFNFLNNIPTLSGK